jgi:hypothetical protein
MGAPRYFVASGTPAVAASSNVAHALDAFILRDAEATQEWVVGLDDDGRLTAQRVAPRDLLRPAVQAALAFNEAAGQRTGVLAAQEVHLFELHLLARAPDMPGINDPVYLQGCLIGPLSARSTGMTRQEGQLTATRADLLHGLVLGAPAAFQHADNSSGRVTRSFHALLPGDRDERIRRGYGGVLAYPATGLDPQLGGHGNEHLVDEILYSVLRAVWRDVALESPPPARDPDQLPVPSESAYHQRLIADGFRIKGNRAVRRRPGPLGWFIEGESRRLPTQGNTNAFIALAREALVLLPSWPPPRIAQLMTDPPPDPREEPQAPVAPPRWREGWINRFIEAQDNRGAEAESYEMSAIARDLRVALRQYHKGQVPAAAVERALATQMPALVQLGEYHRAHHLIEKLREADRAATSPNKADDLFVATALSELEFLADDLEQQK